MMTIVIILVKKMHKQQTQNSSSSERNKGGLYVEKLFHYFFELIIVFGVDHAVFHHENDQADFHVCQGETSPLEKVGRISRCCI